MRPSAPFDPVDVVHSNGAGSRRYLPLEERTGNALLLQDGREVSLGMLTLVSIFVNRLIWDDSCHIFIKNLTHCNVRKRYINKHTRVII